MAGILSKKKDVEFMEKLLETLRSEERGSYGFLVRLRCLVENEHKDFAKNMIKKHLMSLQVFEFRSLNDVDCITVSFLLNVLCELNGEATEKYRPFTRKKLSISDSNLSKSGITRVCKSLDKELSAVVTLWLNGCGLNDECVDCMSELVSSRL